MPQSPQRPILAAPTPGQQLDDALSEALAVDQHRLEELAGLYAQGAITGREWTPEQRARHLLAGTAIDILNGVRACDPKRLAIYFTKH